MLKPLKHVQDLLAENTELVARLKLAESQVGDGQGPCFVSGRFRCHVFDQVFPFFVHFGHG